MGGPDRAKELTRASGIVGISMLVGNVATYVFTLIAARLLGPDSFGALSALVGLMIIGNVVSNGLQATGARRIAENPGSRAEVEHGVLRLGRIAAAGIALLFLIASPAVAELLKLESWISVALAGLALGPLTLMGAQSGILQGERQWSALAAIYLTSGLGRLAVGTLAMVARPDTLGAMVGVAAGTLLPVTVGAFAVRRTAVTTPASPIDASAGSIAAEIAHSSHILFAFFALSNLDVLLARIVLSGHESGLYAAGLIVAKACLFLPQFVVVVMFPDMADHARSSSARRHALVAIGAFGSAAVAGAWLLQDLVVAFVGGPEYVEVGPRAWLFAATGVTYAWLQILVYGSLAKQQRAAAIGLWGGAAVLALLAVLLASTVVGLVGIVLAVALTTVVTWLLVTREPGRRSA